MSRLGGGQLELKLKNTFPFPPPFLFSFHFQRQSQIKAAASSCQNQRLALAAAIERSRRRLIKSPGRFPRVPLKPHDSRSELTLTSTWTEPMEFGADCKRPVSDLLELPERVEFTSRFASRRHRRREDLQLTRPRQRFYALDYRTTPVSRSLRAAADELAFDRHQHSVGDKFVLGWRDFQL